MIPDDEFRAALGKPMSDGEMRAAFKTLAALCEGSGGIGNIPTAIQALALIVGAIVAERAPETFEDDRK